MVNISGTYIDAPLHRIEGGDSIADIPLEKLVDLPVVVVEMKKGKNYFDIDDFKNINGDLKGYAVLLHSGHDKKFGTPAYGENPPYLTVKSAEYLISKGVVFENG